MLQIKPAGVCDVIDVIGVISVIGVCGVTGVSGTCGICGITSDDAFGVIGVSGVMRARILFASLSAFFLLSFSLKCARRVAGLTRLLCPSPSCSSSASISLAVGVLPMGRGGRSRLLPRRCCFRGSNSSSASGSLTEIGTWARLVAEGCPEGRKRNLITTSK